jgi:hypothetical protein
VVAAKIQGVNKEVADKWELYLAIARDSQRFGSGSGEALAEVEVRRLDRLDAELLRLEIEMLESDASTTATRETIGRRIAEMQKQRNELQRQVERRSETSGELEMLERDIERLQRIVDELSRELMDLEIEIETRGLSRKSNRAC